MPKKLPSVDVVLVGFGWTGAILGQELTDAGLNVLALERGGWRDTSTDFAVTFAQDELRYYYRRALFEEPARETLTFRNDPSETALPMRHLGSFLPATGVGGATSSRVFSFFRNRQRPSVQRIRSQNASWTCSWMNARAVSVSGS